MEASDNETIPKQESAIPETELKVIPLASSTEALPLSTKPSTESAAKVSSEASIESTTGHFLWEATFQLNQSNSDETSKASDVTTVASLVNLNETVEATESPEVQVKASINYSKCAAGRFECLNGTSIKDGSACISQSERCDSIAHCSDGSDEADCEALGCPGHFQCADKSCLARPLVCDGVVQCKDGSDEDPALCSKWQCEFDEISCGEKGPCLPSILQCDGIQHCPNGTDEMNCPDNCRNDQFYCSWQRKCIPDAWLCDGKFDCSDGEDERACDCSAEQFKCNTGGCVSQKFVCDGEAQCPDASDEWNCLNLTMVESEGIQVSALRVKRSDGRHNFVCADNWNQNMSNAVCATLGYAEANYWTALRFGTDNEKTVAIDADAAQSGLIGAWNETEKCESQSIVTIICEQYSKLFLRNLRHCHD